MKPFVKATLLLLLLALRGDCVATRALSSVSVGFSESRHLNLSVSGHHLQLPGIRPDWLVTSVALGPAGERLEFELTYTPGGQADGVSLTLTAALPTGFPGEGVRRVSIWDSRCVARELPFPSISKTGPSQLLPAGSAGDPRQGLLGEWHAARASTGSGSGSGDVDVVILVDRPGSGGDGCQEEGAEGLAARVGGATRTLLQDSASCTLALGSQNFQFDACTQMPTRPPSQYQIFYSLSPAPDGNGTVWRGGMKVNAAQFPGGQWAGLGFPQYPATMIGTNAIIVKECSKCSSGADVGGYALKQYVPEANVKGSYNITDAQAAKLPDGSLAAVFTATVPNKALSDLAGPEPADLNYAIGPLKAEDESILPHISGNFPYGGAKVQLQGPGGGGRGTGSPDPATEQSSPPATFPPVPSPLSATSPPPAPSTAGVAGAAAADAGGPPAPAAQVESTPQGAGGAGSCVLQMGSNMLTFHACTPVNGIGSNYHIFWEAPLPSSSSGSNSGNGNGGSGSSSGRTLVRFGMNATSDGWVGLGFPATPGRMIGSTALVLRVCSSCPSGVTLLDYFLGAKNPSAVQPPGKLPVRNLAAAKADGGWLQGSFEIELDSAAVAAPEFPLIFAAGSVAGPGGPRPGGPGRRLLSEYDLQQHGAYGAATVNLPAGNSSHVAGADPKKERMKNAHAWLMVISWGFLLPSGVVIARCFKTLGPVWFQIHRAVQILGLTCALAAFIVIFYAVGPGGTIYTLHRRLGISAMTLGLTQLSALFVRPHHDSRWRRPWNLFHWWVGRAAVLVATANIYEGIIHVKQVGSWGVIAYTVVFSCIVATGMLKDSWDYVHLPPPALMETKYPSSRVEREEALAGRAHPAHGPAGPPTSHSPGSSAASGGKSTPGSKQAGDSTSDVEVGAKGREDSVDGMDGLHHRVRVAVERVEEAV